MILETFQSVNAVLTKLPARARIGITSAAAGPRRDPDRPEASSRTTKSAAQETQPEQSLTKD
jgi:hypothetical protein